MANDTVTQQPNVEPAANISEVFKRARIFLPLIFDSSTCLYLLGPGAYGADVLTARDPFRYFMDFRRISSEVSRGGFRDLPLQTIDGLISYQVSYCVKQVSRLADYREPDYRKIRVRSLEDVMQINPVEVRDAVLSVFVKEYQDGLP